MATSGKSKIVRARPHHIQSFGKHLSTHVSEVTEVLQELFLYFLNNRISGTAREVTIDLFADWCRNTDIVTLDVALESTEIELVPLIHQRIAGSTIDDTSLQNAIRRLEDKLGFNREEISDFVSNIINETIPAVSSGTDIKQAVENAFSKSHAVLYQNAISRFCIQTAHVIIARIVLYRVGEDKEIFGVKLSGNGLKNHRTHPQTLTTSSNTETNLVEEVRQEMEKLLPAVYEHMEFDWWYVPTVYRGLLKEELVLLDYSEAKLNTIFSQLLDILDGFDLGDIDKDVWKDVYQYYLDEEVRQRLGGFYTSDELSSLTLDLAGYKSSLYGLCRKSLFDPSCGSGTFAVEASLRLLAHLGKKTPCHADVHDLSQPTWIRSKKVLDHLIACVYGNDIHPFAQFLTMVNLFFLVLSYFIEVRRYEPNYVLDFKIGCFDSLRDEAGMTMLDSLYNSRLKTAEVRRRRHSDLLNLRFDFVIGNPPWGGILKGKLSPLYGEQKRKSYKKSFDTADGKYDIHVLFLERGVKWLKDAGVLGFITPNSYIDKDFGKETRYFLSNNTCIDFLIDIGSVGRIFFPDAMNTPVVTILSNKSNQQNFIVSKISSEANKIPGTLQDKRKQIVKIVHTTISMVTRAKPTITHKYTTTFQLPSEVIPRGGKEPWVLHPLFTVKAMIKSGIPVSISHLLRTMQGITIGGEGCLDIYLIDSKTKVDRDLEDQITIPVIKGKEIPRWKYKWEGNWTIYPYLDNPLGNELPQIPAFTIDNKMSGYQKEDALDFKGLSRDDILGELNKRIAQGLIKFENVARYLVEHYDRIANRVLEGKPVTTVKRWYEYHRPRERRAMLTKNKIIIGKYVDTVKFAYETQGCIPQDSVFIMLPSYSEEWNRLCTSLSACLGKKASEDDCMLYILGVANSEVADLLLKLGKNRTPKGHFSVTDQVFSDIRIPIPISDSKRCNKVKEVIQLVSTLLSEQNSKSISSKEKRLNSIIFDLFEINDSIRRKIVAYNRDAHS